MNIVEVPINRSHDGRRLARATALLLSGAAVHLWLFPFAGDPARHRLLDTVTSAVRTVAQEGAIATSGVEAGVVTSSPGASTAAAAVAAKSARPTDRVKVLVQTVHPILAPSLIPTRPAVWADALLTTMVPPPQPAVPPEAGGEGAVPAHRAELPPVADTAAAAELRPRAGPLPLAPAPTEATVRASHIPAHREVAERPSEERLVSHVLQQYREAYESLDVTAAQNVWPTVDARALGAAFRQLAGQRVTFDSCGVSVSGSGSQATAHCRGQAEYVPKVGSRRAYTASGEWVFNLQKNDAAWQITNANANIK